MSSLPGWLKGTHEISGFVSEKGRLLGDVRPMMALTILSTASTSQSETYEAIKGSDDFGPGRPFASAVTPPIFV
jgi:hypothetical protein